MFGFPCWKSSNPKVIRIKTYLCENFCQIKAPELIPGDLFRVKIREKMGNYTLFQMFENPRRGQQARNFTTNVPKILDLKSSSEQIFSKKWHWVPCGTWRTRTHEHQLFIVTSLSAPSQWTPVSFYGGRSWTLENNNNTSDRSGKKDQCREKCKTHYE